MLLEASQLYRFYDSPLGATAREVISRRLELVWPTARGFRVLGYGFAVPYLSSAADEAERVVAMMPAVVGVIPWPKEKPLTVLGEETALPFADAVFDRILVVHGLEGAENTGLLLRQLWRVLAPEGRILIVAPNRASLWAVAEVSPFACGRPFRKGELAAMLRAAMFEPLSWDDALYLPPRGRGKPALWWETLGRRFFPAVCGVHIVEAKKSLYGAALRRQPAASERVLVRA